MTDAPSPTDDRSSTDDEPTADDRTTADGRATPDDRPLPNGGSNPADRPSGEARPVGDGAGAGTDSSAGAPSTGRDVRSYVYWAGFGVLSLLAVVALFRFYTSATAAIDLWVEPEFEPIMQAAFNLVVLLLAGIGISWTVRQLS